MSEQVQVTLHEAKSQLLQLGARAWQGDKVVITKAGKPYLDLLPHVATPQARKPGRLKGKIRMSADFERIPEDIIDSFEGRL
ncbi:type II toxin-antitoxin system Phd/YefM family antitoxin [Pseudomonas sp. Z3-8]|uniref:type II toxin-antitoxin system Phd/YefM family antitoxin n=1 Tax=Pseudomonas sp. Z3-8 TaxID=2817412 RepID=UPI003DA7D6D2